MSPDMFHDDMSSTPIPVFTTANEVDKNDLQNPLQNVTEEFTSVPNGTPVKLQAEIIKVDFDKQTVSARALYEFFAPAERFHFWCKRMFSYGLVENVDFTTVNFLTVVNKGGTKEIGDYLLTIDAAKNIAMVQRSEKGKQARQYFIDVEKLYLKNLYSNNQTDATLIEKIRNLIVENDGEMVRRDDYKLLAEKNVALEQKLALHNLKDEYIERTISKKIDIALKASFREAEQISGRDEFVNRLTHQNPVVVLNQLEKTIQKTTLEEDLIRKCYRPAERKNETALFLTATEITHQLELLSKRVTVRSVGIALKKLGFERLHRGINGNQLKGYYVIQLFNLM